MKKKLMTGILVMILIAGITQFASARNGRNCPFGQGPEDSFRMGLPLLNAPWDQIQDAAKAAGLNEQQLEKIQLIRQDHRHKMEPLHSQIRLMRGDLRDMLSGESKFDAKNAEQLAEKIADLEKSLIKEQISLHVKMNEVLSNEQCDKMKEFLKEQRQDRRDDRQDRREDRRQDRQERRENRGDNP